MAPSRRRPCWACTGSTPCRWGRSCTWAPSCVRNATRSALRSSSATCGAIAFTTSEEEAMFRLAEYQQEPYRLADLVLWAGLLAPGVLVNKDGAFQQTLR